MLELESEKEVGEWGGGVEQDWGEYDSKEESWENMEKKSSKKFMW
jgi:hypothetical protein